MTDTHLPQQWRERLLGMLLAPVRQESLRFLTAWARAEGGTAQYNPLNTTYPMPWSSDYNSIHVKNYDTPLEGLAATAATFGRDKLTGSHYLSLWIDLQTGTYTAEELVNRNMPGISHWGTDPYLVLRILKDV